VIFVIICDNHSDAKYVFVVILENAMKDPRIDRAMGVCKKVVSSFSYSWK